MLPAALLLGLMVTPAATPADDPGRLAVIRPAPDFTLTDTDGKAVSLRQFSGKAVLVGFVFTTCSGTCPATTHRMARVQQEVERHPDLRDRVQFVSVTLDPARDTPEALRHYMRLYDVDGRNWSFVTGPAGAVNRAVADWGMWARPAANGQLDHPSRVFLVDPRGRVREIYNLDFFRVPWVVEDLRLVLREGP
jgi:protein SCO1/2